MKPAYTHKSVVAAVTACLVLGCSSSIQPKVPDKTLLAVLNRSTDARQALGASGPAQEAAESSDAGNTGTIEYEFTLTGPIEMERPASIDALGLLRADRRDWSKWDLDVVAGAGLATITTFPSCRGLDGEEITAQIDARVVDSRRSGGPASDLSTSRKLTVKGHLDGDGYVFLEGFAFTWREGRASATTKEPAILVGPQEGVLVELKNPMGGPPAFVLVRAKPR